MGHNESSPKSKVYSAKCLYKVSPELICLAAYVTEDGLVGHHCEERPLDIANSICPNTRECQGQQDRVDG